MDIRLRRYRSAHFAHVVEIMIAGDGVGLQHADLTPPGVRQHREAVAEADH
jgi:hypothetical protein